MPSASEVRVGFFGKLPSRGDFVRIGLSRPAATAWDRWLSPMLPDLPDASQMPPWRFAFTAGVCGPAAITGVLLPSRDRVGRSFPLLIAAEAAWPNESFLDAAELIGITAIRDLLAPAMLMDRLYAAPWPTPAGPDAGLRARWWRKGGERAGFAEEIPPRADALLRIWQP